MLGTIARTYPDRRCLRRLNYIARAGRFSSELNTTIYVPQRDRKVSNIFWKDSRNNFSDVICDSEYDQTEQIVR